MLLQHGQILLLIRVILHSCGGTTTPTVALWAHRFQRLNSPELSSCRVPFWVSWSKILSGNRKATRKAAPPVAMEKTLMQPGRILMWGTHTLCLIGRSLARRLRQDTTCFTDTKTVWAFQVPPYIQLSNFQLSIHTAWTHDLLWTRGTQSGPSTPILGTWKLPSHIFKPTTCSYDWNVLTQQSAC